MYLPTYRRTAVHLEEEEECSDQDRDHCGLVLVVEWIDPSILLHLFIFQKSAVFAGYHCHLHKEVPSPVLKNEQLQYISSTFNVLDG